MSDQIKKEEVDRAELFKTLDVLTSKNLTADDLLQIHKQLLTKIESLELENAKLKNGYTEVYDLTTKAVKELRDVQLPQLKNSMHTLEHTVVTNGRNPVNFNFGDKILTASMTEAHMLTEMNTMNIKLLNIDLNNPAMIRENLRRVIDRLSYYETKIGTVDINLNLKWINRALFGGTHLQDCGCTLPTWQQMIERVSVLLGATQDAYAAAQTRKLLEFSPTPQTSLRLSLITFSALIEKMWRDGIVFPSMILLVDKVKSWLPASLQLPHAIISLTSQSTPQELMLALEGLIVGMSTNLIYKGNLQNLTEKKHFNNKRTFVEAPERFVSKKNNFPSNKTIDKSSIKCFKCNNLGHFARDCKKNESVKVGAVKVFGEAIAGSEELTPAATKIYVDTMAGHNVVNATLASLSKPITKQILVKGVNSKPTHMKVVETTIKIPRGPKLTFEAVVDNSHGAMNLLRPDVGSLFGTEFKFKGIKINSIMDKHRGTLYFNAVPVVPIGIMNPRSIVQSKIQSTFNVAFPEWSDNVVFAFAEKLHQWLGCAGKEIMGNTLRTLGCALPMRLIESAIRMCLHCKDKLPPYNEKHGELFEVLSLRPTESNGSTLHVDLAVFNDKPDIELTQLPDNEQTTKKPTREENKRRNLLRMKNTLEQVEKITDLDENTAKFFIVGVITPGDFFMTDALINKSAAKEVIREWLKEYPQIKRIHSDQAPEFISVAKEAGVHITTSEVGESNTNAKAEVSVRIAKKVLSSLMFQHATLNKEWEFFARTVGYVINSRTNTAGTCPFLAMYGRLPTFSFCQGRKINVRTPQGFKQGFCLGEFKPKQFDVWILDKDKIEEKHQVVLQSEPIKLDSKVTVGALTSAQTLRLPVSYPGVKQKLQQEFETLVDMNCFELSNESEVDESKVVSVILIPTLRNGSEIKVRVGLRGDLIVDNNTIVTAELPNLPLRLIHLINLLKFEHLGATDVKKAYYQTPYSGEIKLRLPKTIQDYKGFKPGMIVTPKRVIPGLPEGANLWISYLKTKLEEINFTEIATGVFRNEVGSTEIQAFMDDIIIGSHEPIEAIHNVMNSKINLDVLENGLPTRYCGISFQVNEDQSIYLSMDSYVESLEDDKKLSVISEECVTELEKLQKNDQETNYDLPRSQEIVGKLAWYSQFSPALKYLHSLMSSKMHINAQLTAELAAKTIPWIRKYRPKILFKPIPSDKVLEVRLWADASHNLKEMKAVYGSLIQLVSEEENIESRANVISMQVKRSKALVKSAFAAELHAAIVAVGTYLLYKQNIQIIHARKIVVNLYTDNKALHLAINAERTNDPFSVIYLKFLLQELKKIDAKVIWVPTVNQLADGLTKFRNTINQGWTIPLSP